MYLIKIPFKSQLSALKIVSNLLRVNYGESLTPPARTLLLFQRNYVRVRRRIWTSPTYPPLLWESEASCRFHSPLCQRSNHSPVCKPPVLQDIGNLEQETTVTHTLTSLSLHTQLTRMGDRKAPEHGDCPSHSGLYQVHTLEDPQVRRGQATF